MMISVERLTTLLSPHGFRLIRRNNGCHEVVFGRRSYADDLTERIHIHAQGEAGGAVPARLAILVDGLAAEWELLTDLAENKERGWTIIDTTEKAIAWEKKLAEVAPARLTELAREKGPNLLARTEHVRSQARAYLAFLGEIGDAHALLPRLRAMATPEQNAEVDRLVQRLAVVYIPNGDPVYKIVGLTLYLFSGKTERDANRFLQSDVYKKVYFGDQYLGKEPIGDKHMQQLIQMMADLLTREHKPEDYEPRDKEARPPR